MEPKEPKLETTTDADAEEPEEDRHTKEESLCHEVDFWTLKLMRARIDGELRPKLTPKREKTTDPDDGTLVLDRVLKAATS